jgi:DNA primase
MGRIPPQFIDELLARVDIVEVIDSRVPLKKKGSNYAACCPFHNEKTPSFTVSPDKQFYHCFGCGAHGTAIGFLMEYEHRDFVEAVEELAAGLGMEVPREGGTGPQPQQRDLYRLLDKAAQYFRDQLRNHPQAGRAIDYLKGRGLSGRIAADYGIGYAPDGWDGLLRVFGRDLAAQAALVKAGLLIEKDNGRRYDRFRDRIMFPIRNRSGKVIAFGGRVLGDGEPKYLNSPETPVFHKGRELYGLYEARKSGRDLPWVLVVEGYMDVVALAQHGIHNAVATLGTAATKDHLEQLYRLTAQVVFCFDGDRAGRAAAWRALQNALPAMKEGNQARFLFLPEGEDPDTLVRKEGPEAFRARVGGAMPLSDYLLQELERQTDTTTREGRARLYELARPLLATIPDGSFRQILDTELRNVARVEGAVPTPATMAAGGRQASAGRSPLEPRTLVQQAIAMLLYRPQLATVVERPKDMDGEGLAGMGLFLDLLETWRREPNLTTGAMLERYRQSENGPHLAKLATWEPPATDMDLEQAFRETMQRLRSRHRAMRVERLIRKERESGLNDAEKRLLGSLLAERKRQE